MLLMNTLLSLRSFTVCMCHPASVDGVLRESFIASSSSKLASQVWGKVLLNIITDFFLSGMYFINGDQHNMLFSNVDKL